MVCVRNKWWGWGGRKISTPFKRHLPPLPDEKFWKSQRSQAYKPRFLGFPGGSGVFRCFTAPVHSQIACDPAPFPFLPSIWLSTFCAGNLRAVRPAVRLSIAQKAPDVALLPPSIPACRQSLLERNATTGCLAGRVSKDGLGLDPREPTAARPSPRNCWVKCWDSANFLLLRQSAP